MFHVKPSRASATISAIREPLQEAGRRAVVLWREHHFWQICGFWDSLLGGTVIHRATENGGFLQRVFSCNCYIMQTIFGIM